MSRPRLYRGTSWPLTLAGCERDRFDRAGGKRGLIHDGRGKKKAGKSAIFILGGGSPKNFALQTEPQIRKSSGSTSASRLLSTGHRRATRYRWVVPAPLPAKQYPGKVDSQSLTDAVVCIWTRRWRCHHHGVCSSETQTPKAPTALPTS